MAKHISPKQYFQQFRDGTAPEISFAHDFLLVEELGKSFSLAGVFDERRFLDDLKKATSEFNLDAALNGDAPLDFDDLSTKYCEYIETLKSFS